MGARKGEGAPKLPPERNRTTCGLHALYGTYCDSPRLKSDFVAELRAIGVAGSWHGEFVFAEERFAQAWQKVITRFKGVPMRGARLRAAIRSAEKKMEVPA